MWQGRRTLSLLCPTYTTDNTQVTLITQKITWKLAEGTPQSKVEEKPHGNGSKGKEAI